MSCVGALCTLMVAPTPVDFKEVAGGIAYSKTEASAGFSAHVFRIDIPRVALSLVPAGKRGERDSIQNIVPDIQNALVTNASFFDRDGSAMGLVASGGELLQPKAIGRWPALVVDGGSSRIAMGEELRQQKYFEFALQGLPRLVRDGVVPRLKPQRSERTAVCAEDKRIFLVVTSPVFAADLAQYLSAPHLSGGLGCRNAMNLDGGPSTQLVARFQNLSLQVAGGNGVPNALVIRPVSKQ